MGKDAGLLAEVERDVLSGASVADVLRKCIVIGGRTSSAELRDWATAELRGYGNVDAAPSYRQVGAPIYADAITGSHHIKGQRISRSMLPDFAQDDIKETYTFQVGIGEIEALIEQCRRDGETQAKLSLPMAADLAHLMDQGSGNPWQHIGALYWGISVASLEGIVDQVKTTAAQLIAELRAVTPLGADLPSSAATTQAVNVAVHGKARNITVSTGLASDQSVVNASQPSDGVGWWTRGRKIGAFAVGAAGIASAVLAAFQVYGSPF